jgi:hypothetical protein
MDFQTFRRLLTTFADRAGDFNASRGQLLVEVHGDLIDAGIAMREGSVWVTEQGRTASAEEWITQRIARLPQLADRLLSFVPEEGHFISPSASLLDQLEIAPTEAEVAVSDAADSAIDYLGRKPAGTSSVLYLTSDAGEGKTTLINQIARRVARAYKEKTTDYLVVPIPLGGRTFLRLDDVVIGALVNRLRFPYLYFESFVELVRIGAIVPALDGFEEMFIESAPGEAVSALGTLVQSLRSSGTVMVAARKAYFEYRSFETQSRLYDALGEESVSFARMNLARWDREHFLRYAQSRSIQNPEALHERVAARLGASHPLLTRAVLVRRLLDLATANDSLAFLETLTGKTEDFFSQFVGAIVEREAHEKWIDKQGDAHAPLLSVSQHCELLSMVAQEMWENNVDALRSEVMDLLAELFCEQARLPVVVARQVTERLKQHALVVQDPQRRMFSFDHEEFYYYFLGLAVARVLQTVQVAEARRLLRVADLPRLTADVAVHAVDAVHLQKVVDCISQAADAEGPASFTRENAGGLLLRLMARDVGKVKEVRSLTFPEDNLAGRTVEQMTFTGCYFRPTRLSHTTLRNCIFVDCEFERIEFTDGHTIEKTRLENCRVHRVSVADPEIDAFEPKRVSSLLAANGFAVKESTTKTVDIPTTASVEREGADVDEELNAALRFIRVFLRATEVNEQTIRARLGSRYNLFEQRVLPVLLERELVQEVAYSGSGVQRRFKLQIRMNRVEQAERVAAGNFRAFLNALPG